MCLSIRVLVILSLLAGCSQKKPAVQAREFYNFDSLVSSQIKTISTHTLEKSVEIGEMKDSASFVPNEAQWSNELAIFRQLDEVNKASFRDAYTVTETRDTKSNLNVREIKSNRLVPVALLRLYYLRSLKDLRKIEATWTEENTLYVNDRKLTMEFEGMMHKYTIEGFQKMVMNDSVKFRIEGTVK